MSWLENRSPIVRWLLVIPAAIGAALLGNLAPTLLDFSGHAAAGDFGGLVAFAIAPFSSAFLGGYVFVTGPAQVAPRGRTAVASVMFALVVIGSALGIITIAAGHNQSIYPGWWWIASGVLTLGAGLLALIEIAGKQADHRTPTPGYSPFVSVPTPDDEEDADDEPAIEQTPHRWGEIEAKAIDVRSGVKAEPGDLLRHNTAGVGRFGGTQMYDDNEFAILTYADSERLFIPIDKAAALEKVSASTPLDKLPNSEPTA